jgi:hypothetical protein
VGRRSLGTKVAANITALDTALATVSAHLSAGTLTAADVSAAISAQATLSTDLGANLSMHQLHILTDVHDDLLALAIEVAGLRL